VLYPIWSSQTVVWRDFVSFLLLEGPVSHPFSPTAYAATTRNQDYVKMEGLKQLVSDQEHRQEIVASGLGPYLSCRAFVGAICISPHLLFHF
jgi:hypothetical protein